MGETEPERQLEVRVDRRQERLQHVVDEVAAADGNENAESGRYRGARAEGPGANDILTQRGLPGETDAPLTIRRIPERLLPTKSQPATAIPNIARSKHGYLTGDQARRNSNCRVRLPGRTARAGADQTVNVPLFIGFVMLIVVTLAIVIEVGRLRSVKRRRRQASSAPPRRLVHLEQRMKTAFEGPRESYGELFAEFSIWRRLGITRMDVRTRNEWRILNIFTRSLIVRHLWETLGSLVKGPASVNVDVGAPDAMIWTAAETERFNDCGVIAPWTKNAGHVGTLISE